MIVRRGTFFLGIFIFLLPFLGLPTFWKTFFIIFSGVTLSLLSLRMSLPRKVIRTKVKTEKESPIQVQDVIKREPVLSEPMIRFEAPMVRKVVRRKSPTKTSVNKTS